MFYIGFQEIRCQSISSIIASAKVHNPDIARAITRAPAEKTVVTKGRIVNELMSIAFARPADYVM